MIGRQTARKDARSCLPESSNRGSKSCGDSKQGDVDLLGANGRIILESSGLVHLLTLSHKTMQKSKKMLLQ